MLAVTHADDVDGGNIIFPYPSLRLFDVPALIIRCLLRSLLAMASSDEADYDVDDADYDVDEGDKADEGKRQRQRQRQQQRQRQRQPEKGPWMAPNTHAMKREHAKAAKMAAARRRTRPWNMPLDPNMPEHAHGSLTPRATDYWLVAARRRIMLMDMPVAEQAHIARLKLSRKLAAYGDGTLARAWGCAPEPGTRCRKASQRRMPNDKNDTPGVSGRFAPGS